MQEHPVPQNVTGYEFHLIGSMTLKQFMELAGGVLFAVIANSTNLPGIIKIPIAILSVAIGAGMAFLPFEGRPLDRWIIAFIRSIYQPTMFFWKKTQSVPQAFEFVPSTVVQQVTFGAEELRPYRKTRYGEFMQTVTTVKPSDKPTDEEDEKIRTVMALFTQTVTPSLDKLGTVGQQPERPTMQMPTQPAPIETKDGKLDVSKEIPKPLDKLGTVGQPLDTKLTEMHTLFSATPSDVSEKVKTSTTLPFPSVPKTPNLIVGMVVTKDEKILDNAIVTVSRKFDGLPVRALKTNALGQFEVATPLEDGEYVVSVEKDGFSFEKSILGLKNSIINPLFIKAN
ncbi:MAG TPA: PrgI family protein [Patescibacteria group bacterium]|nr:PrgI family protein [Patescibacteria group bacterium]